MANQNQTLDQYRQSIKNAIPVLEQAIKEFETAIFDAEAVGQDMSQQRIKLSEMKSTLAAYKKQFS